jgi:hypothetical protein
MIKLLDNYYLTLTRWGGKKYIRIAYRNVELILCIFVLNLMSLVYFFYPSLVSYGALPLFFFVFMPLGFIILRLLRRRYTAEFTEKLWEDNKDESSESRRRKVLWVVTYWVLSLLLIIFSGMRVAQ